MDLTKKLGWSEKVFVLDREKVNLKELLSLLEDLKSVVLSNLDDYMVLVNGVNIKLLKGIETEICSDSTIDIFPPAAGG